MRKTATWAAVVAAGVLALAGCGSSNDNSGSGSSSSSSAGGSSASDAVLSTGDSDLGTIVVTADGRSVYVFDKDTAGSGKSVCSGGCAAEWPAVTADSDSPAVDGVSGDVGTITRDDGTTQVTLNGMPLYMFDEDSQAGDVKGQAFNGIWWVIGADGTKITTAGAAATSSAPAPTPGY